MPSNLKIPRVATAVLVLGGACGNEEEDTSDGIDISRSRQEKVAAGVCSQWQQCDHDVDTDFNLADCAESYVAELRAHSRGNEDCLDAVLDYYECYAAIACDLDVAEALERADECGEISELEERCMSGE